MQTGGGNMSDYSSTIKKLNDDLLAFINDYELLTIKDPITNHLLNKIKKLVNSHNFASNQHVEILEKHEKNFEKLLKNISDVHAQDIEKIRSQLDVSINVINDKYVKKINLLKENISKSKLNKENKLNELNKDIDYFFIASEQRASLIEGEYNSNIKKYEYQIQNAKKTYRDSIKKYNEILDIKLNELETQHENALVNFDQSTDEIVNRLRAQIDKHLVELNEITGKLTNVRNQSKEKMRQESVMLNEQIHEILLEKNCSIDVARERYTKALAESAAEKDKNRQEYQANSQMVLKNFVYNMTELDEYISNYKISYNKSIERAKRDFHYKLLELTKNEEADVKNILSNGYSIDNEYDKYTKKLVKAKNKEYQKLNNQYKAQHDKKLNNFKLSYERELEKSRCNKNLMDIDRAHALKILNEKEQSNNKHFQELNSIYENNMNYLIKYSNMKFNQKANLLKCQSRIRAKGFEKDLDISEANFQKKIEMVNTSIEKLNLEIKGALDLNNLVHQYEDEEYKERINNLNVTTLLEIEKCKLLDQFNHRQYENNIIHSKNTLLYGKKKIDIENDKFETLTRIEIDKTKNSLQSHIITSAYNIKEEQICEDEDKKIQIRNSQYAIDSRNHDALYDRFKGENKAIHQTLSTFVMLFRDTEAFASKVINTIFNTITIKEEYFEQINAFIFEFLEIILKYIRSLITGLTERENKLINKHLEFEEKFKFQVYYNELLQSYEADRKKLLTKKNSINDTLENYDKTVDTFRSRLYSFQNQNDHIKSKMLIQTSKEQKESLVKEFNKNNIKINDFRKKIEDILGFKSVLEKDSKAINNELKNLDYDYNRRVKEIKKMQYNSAISYYDLRNEFSKLTSTILDECDEFLQAVKKIPINYLNTSETIAHYKSIVNTFNSSVCRRLYGIVYQFGEKTRKSIKKDKRLLVIKFANDIERIHNKARNQIDNNNREYDKKMSNSESLYKALESKYLDEEKRYNQLINQVEQQYTSDSNEIVESKNKSLIRFYTEFNAMCENLKYIESSFKQFMHSFKNKFHQDKLTLSKDVVNESNILSNNLEIFIKAKNDIINHLPAATRFQSQQFTKETRDLNSQIDSELKAERLSFNSERKLIQRNINDIEEALNQALILHEEEHQRNIIKEKKNHIVQLKHIENEFKYS